ncbi:hypothetical protein BD779DRAFT_1670938 [Infundibulicybe gibba]|nr:hypothetical protein BD779DRAFT_1670938 [Infundibulicybe gibba]
MTSTPDSIDPSDIIVALQEVRATTQIQALRSAAELSLNIYFDAQTSDHELHNLRLPLAVECCRIVHRILSIPSIQASHTTASSLPLAEDVQHLLRILQDIQDQLRDPRVARRVTCNRVEQYQRDLNHRLNRILNEQSRLTSNVQAITLDSADDGVQGPVLSRLLTCMFSIAPTPSLITDVASKIHMGLLLFIPLLYSSRIQGILSEVNHGTGLETPFLATEDDLGASRPRMALGLWDTFSRGLVKEWMALRVLSGLILATIFSMLQISGFQGNEPMMVATLFSFAAVVYSSILMIYVDGWRGNSGASRWIQEIHEPFTIGFLWNTWILLALPAIWTAW